MVDPYIHRKQNNARKVAFCDVAHKHSCPPRLSPLENILKCKHLFISRVRIEIILLYGELSLIKQNN